MRNIIEFETDAQREYNRLSVRAEKNLKAYGDMMERKERKFKMKGSLTEDDIDEILLGMAMLARDSREKHELLKKINPEGAAEIEEIERKAFKAAKEQFYEEEYGLKVIK